MNKQCPVSDWDPFSDEALADPFSAYEELRNLAPIVHLQKYDCLAVLDFTAMSEVLSDWETYSSAAGVGLANFNTDPPWRPKSIILEVDPPEHDITRRVLNRVLSRPAMEKMRQTFSVEAKRLVASLVATKEFDGVKDLAEVYPLMVFPDAVGLVREGRENLLLYGSMVFNATYTGNRHFEDAAEKSGQTVEWILKQCARDALTEDGLGAQTYAAADKGEISEEEAGMLVRSLLSAGVDTTVNAIGSALYCFGRNPEQWQILRENPELARGVIDEVLRLEGGVINFFRTTTRESELCGYHVPENTKVLVLFSAANRDPKRWHEPEKFDIQRDLRDHVGFGGGIHKCVGQMVARLEMELILTELINTVSKLDIIGEPVRRLNNGLRGLDSLPLRVS